MLKVRWPLLTLAILAWGVCWHRPMAEMRAQTASKADPVADPSKAAQAAFDAKILPFLKTYCTHCHGDRRDRAGINLEVYTHVTQAMQDRDVWVKVRENLLSGQMPPKREAQPAQNEREAVARWIKDQLTRIDCGKALNPGRVTLRRLNRAEYNNTIRDLVGVDFRPADDFPSDDVGYGFDNIGDVLSMPPILLEKYLAAAEKIAKQAIVDVHNIPVSEQSFRGNALRRGRGVVRERGYHVFSTNATCHLYFTFSHTGDYLFRLRAHGDQAGDEPVRVRLDVDGKPVKTFEVHSDNRRKPDTLEVRVKGIQKGRRRVAVSFINDYYNKDAAEGRKDRNLWLRSLGIQGPFNAVPPPLPESHRRVMITLPNDAGDELRAAREILADFARRAYRRPVTDQEVERLLKFVKLAKSKGEAFEGQIRLAMQAVLVSPHFLFKVEQDPQGEATKRRIDAFEFATRLSYFLWSSMPDEELFRLAEQGKLREPAILQAQVKRMLKDPKAEALVNNFAGQWLQLRRLAELQPDVETFPTWSDDLKADMVRETELFFEHVVRDNRPVLEFLDANYTFLNERLSKHYRISGVQGPKFRRVELPDERRGGLITQASVLTVTSNPTRTSPVKRGKWVLENILGTPPPPPPPDAGELPEGDGEELKGSLRERLVMHRQSAICASCHQRMDPIGFALENFDGIGQWRDRDGKFAIDASGELPDGSTFTGPQQLRQILINKGDLFRKCLTEKLMTYALGRGLEYYDSCVVEEIAQSLEQSNDRFSSLVLAIVTSEPFQFRTKKGETP